ncbi:protein kinase [Streptomyces sp. NPDC127112]|uniref:serine/threonine-protein kinase n=1 Tax=Streptomyces sp. NPDC127112 TaxID=3345364 RepID=UPI003628E004
MYEGELIAGRYELLDRLGRGGMGEVWVAQDRSLHRKVAVKLLVLGPRALPELAQRFEREAVAAAQINHPSVAAVYDRGAHEDMLYLVMEKVDGGPLSDHVHSGQPMGLAEALAVAEGICTALVAAHRAGVVHYDIKPHNVMLTVERAVKVVDFGVAGFLQTAFTGLARSSQLTPAGTAEYGAPEQFLSARGDERCDLYALGSVMFTLLTGRPPFTGHTPLAVVRRKLDEDAPRLDDVRPGLPPALAELVAALLDRDPARRPGTAREVLERITALRRLGRADATAGADGDGDALAGAARGVWLARFARAARAVAAGQDAERIRRPAAPTRRMTDAFEVGWTGREALRSYAKDPGVVSAWLMPLLLSAFAGSAIFFPLHAGIFERTPGGGLDGPWALIFVLAALVGLAGAVGLGGAVVGTVRELRDKAIREDPAPWRLAVGAAGIVTDSAAGGCHFAWGDIQRVVIQPVRGTSTHDFTGLHLDLEPHSPRPALFRPAGWPYGRPPGGGSRLPVCVLGPLTQRQRIELVEALVEHGGRSVTTVVFTTPPVHA